MSADIAATMLHTKKAYDAPEMKRTFTFPPVSLLTVLKACFFVFGFSFFLGGLDIHSYSSL